MRSDEIYSPPFDEQAALKELERLRDAIEESRRRRSETSDEFEAFVRSFRTPPPAAPTPPTAPAPTPSPAATSGLASSPASPVPAPAPTLTPASPPPPLAPPTAKPDFVDAVRQALAEPLPPPVDELPPASVIEPVPPPKRPARALAPRVLGGAAILIASVVLLTRPWKTVRSESSPSPSTGGAPTTASAPATTEPAPSTTPATSPAAAAETTHAMQAELNVERRVWVRVLVDGERVIERELAPDTRIPLQADRAIVIRAGDAGALRLTINGTDRGPLGREGEIVTRTFTAPPR